ncbi:hypothetical protein EYF80_055152 [Liparis tanakae]|uniref:Uncharacterized protein n=1 Tax=Liparis tanakae TaxID=230148 RepID=A0A4Z2F1E8_9TELE|nr:hypothetical protein EYF80_055152 [Liparis tanakae]
MSPAAGTMTSSAPRRGARQREAGLSDTVEAIVQELDLLLLLNDFPKQSLFENSALRHVSRNMMKSIENEEDKQTFTGMDEQKLFRVADCPRAMAPSHRRRCRLAQRPTKLLTSHSIRGGAGSLMRVNHRFVCTKKHYKQRK